MRIKRWMPGAAAAASILGLCTVADAFAATAIRYDAPIEQIQVYGNSRSSNPDIVWLKLTGAWTGTTCLDHWAWVDAKLDSTIVATALAARLAAAPVTVYVDDSHPKVVGYCQATILMM